MTTNEEGILCILCEDRHTGHAGRCADCDCHAVLLPPTKGDRPSRDHLAMIQRQVENWTARIVETGYVPVITLNEIAADLSDEALPQNLINRAQEVHRLRQELNLAEGHLREALAEAQEDIWS